MDRGIDEARIDSAIAALSLEQKVRLLSGADAFTLAGEASIGLAPLVLSDGPTGVRGPVVVGGRQGCLLPNASLLAQTWSADALTRAASILADEAVAQRTHIVLGPTINLHRSPLGGRLFESFSEDPYLTGMLAAAYVRELQQRGIAASAKHFLGNESETERTTVDVRMDPATMREVYLRPFQIVVEDANPWTVMAAYNLVNGTPSTEHGELIDGTLKAEWGYDGLVMSDWHATSSSVESANAGLDLIMPGPDTPWSASLVGDVERGAVREQVVDEHVRRLLRLAARVGALGEPRQWPEGMPSPASEQRRRELTELAAAGMVVLKNDGVLPLVPSTTERILVVGRHATDTIAQGGGSAQVRPPHLVTIADGMRDAFGEAVQLLDGVDTRVMLPAATPERVADPVTGEPGARVRVFDASGSLSHERQLELPELEDDKAGWLADAARVELSAVFRGEAGQVQLGVRGPGRWHLVAPGVDEMIDVPYHHGPGGGFFRPRSHTVSTTLRPGDRITATVEAGEMARILGLVISPARVAAAAAISRAAEAAQHADTAVVVVGFTVDQETEGQDKSTLALPGEQDALVTAVAAVAPRTVVVLNAATPVLMPWAEQVDAIVLAGLPGQEAGAAVAAALTGAVLPEGRLVTTFPSADGEGPAWSTVPDHGRLAYDEGLFVGHRGWHRERQAPAFWFGHGLGLTSWDYADARASWQDGVLQTVTVTVENTGEERGIETVQVYLEPDDAQQPVRLVGWGQSALAPGERAEVVVGCDARMQSRWSADAGAWLPVGTGTVLVGRSLGDVRARLGQEAALASPVHGERTTTPRSEA